MLARRVCGVLTLAVAASVPSICFGAIEFEVIATRKLKPSSQSGSRLATRTQSFTSSAMPAPAQLPQTELAQATEAPEPLAAQMSTSAATVAPTAPNMAPLSLSSVFTPVASSFATGGDGEPPDTMTIDTAVSLSEPGGQGLAAANAPNAEAVPEPTTLLIWGLAALCGIGLMRMGGPRRS